MSSLSSGITWDLSLFSNKTVTFPNISTFVLKKTCQDIFLPDKFYIFVNANLNIDKLDFNYLVIEGNIGAGKTSLAKKIANDTNSKLILEQFKENPFLPKFYEDSDRYAFPVELTFLADRYKQLKTEIAPRDLFQTKTVSDYYFVKSLIFSRETLKDDEYSLYTRLFEIIQQQLPKPDIYVYLHVDTKKLLSNIKQRGRSYEQEISSSYLEQIQKSYFEFIKTHPELTVLVIDINDIDFVNKDEDYLKLKNAIFSPDYKPGINTVLL